MDYEHYVHPQAIMVDDPYVSFTAAVGKDLDSLDTFGMSDKDIPTRSIINVVKIVWFNCPHLPFHSTFNP